MASKQKTNNLVAKHARQFNKSAVFKDRKQSQKRGYIKHKGRQNERLFFLSIGCEENLVNDNLMAKTINGAHR